MTDTPKKQTPQQTHGAGPGGAHPAEDAHGRSVSRMFGRIAGWYDFLNRFLSAGQDVRWRRELVAQVQPGPTGCVLDLAAGTLDVSLEIMKQQPGMRVVAADFSLPMLVKGRSKIPSSGAARLDTVLADGRALPLPDASVDCVTIAFGIRNIIPRETAFREMHRVLVPGGRVCILEFGSGRTRIWKGLYNFYLKRVLPALGRVFSGDSQAYSYLADTIEKFPGPSDLAAEMESEGLGEVFYKPMMSGIVYLHVGTKATKPATG